MSSDLIIKSYHRDNNNDVYTSYPRVQDGKKMINLRNLRAPKGEWVDEVPKEYTTITPEIAKRIMRSKVQIQHDAKIEKYTAGRISCLARAPIYALGGLFLSALTLVKFFAAFPVTLLTLCYDNPHLESWTFSGMVKEGIMALQLFDRALNSTICFLFAPPEDYRDFSEAITDTIKWTLTERKWQKVEETGNVYSVKKAWELYTKERHQLLSVIIGDREENYRA